MRIPPSCDVGMDARNTTRSSKRATPYTPTTVQNSRGWDARNLAGGNAVPPAICRKIKNTSSRKTDPQSAALTIAVVAGSISQRSSTVQFLSPASDCAESMGRLTTAKKLKSRHHGSAVSVQPEFDWDTLHDFEREAISILIADRVSRIFAVSADVGRMGHDRTPRLWRYNICVRSRQRACVSCPTKSSSVTLSSG